MQIKRFRQIEFWAITFITAIATVTTIYQRYNNFTGIFRKIEPAEMRRMVLEYDWPRNGLWPLLVLATTIYIVWLAISRFVIPRYNSQKPTPFVFYTLAATVLVFGAAVYFLSFWKDLNFRYWIDWCSEHGQDWTETNIIGAKARSPFRWLNVLLLTADILSKIGYYLVLSQTYQWAIQQPKNEEDTNLKIIREGSGLALMLIAISVITKLPNSYHFSSDYYMLSLAAFGHAYLFHYNLIRIPLKTELTNFFRHWRKFLLWLLGVSIFILFLDQINIASYTSWYITWVHFDSFTLDVNILWYNTLSLLALSVGTALVRSLAVRPFQIRLGNKQAELSGLQAQVNPHFLFNALNTLYASAIAEKAELTSGGIQKLSDMMRFMLHQNNKHEIDIRQEVDYLNNYIDLQKLRTAGLKDFEINTQLDDTLCLQPIAPMLLVPFVENAFKHGVSIRQKSWIDIRLRCDGQMLYFTVFNSLHPKSEEDPERNASGIGLENVKKRLQLLYPKRHQLSIHQTAREFSINLEIKVTL